MKDLRVVRTQQRSFDKKYEYIFEVCSSTPSSSAVARTFMGGGGGGGIFIYSCSARIDDQFEFGLKRDSF